MTIVRFLLTYLYTRKLLYLNPIVITLVLTELLNRLGFKRPPRRKKTPPLTWKEGVSVIIPERGQTAMLADCLKALFIAMQDLTEPVEVIILVNGAPFEEYRELRERYASIRWVYHEKPLGFSTSIRKCLALASHDWVYLLNNDMIMEPRALREVLAWRSPRVFAVASQIFFPGETRRREETGWTRLEVVDGIPYPTHLVPEDGESVRGTVYAGAGSSLFHRKLLQRIIPRKDPFHPFYWEDADWSIRAWRLGYDVLFSPGSKVTHEHRATISRYFDREEIGRIFERNRLIFHFRNPLTPLGTGRAIALVKTLDRKTRRELNSIRCCADILASRWWTYRAPFRDVPYQYLEKKYFFRHEYLEAGKPLLLVVSPFAVYPPAHGGAVRIHNLIRELRKDFSIMLVSDEETLYRHEQCIPYFRDLHSVHLIGGRAVETEQEQRSRISRIRTHSHRLLRSEVARAIACYQPALVQVEYMELGGLADLATARPPLVLTLQDVLLRPDDPASRGDDLFEKRLIRRFADVLVCCAEDGSLLGNIRHTIIPNGCEAAVDAYSSSKENRKILFIGPFRCEPNLEGIMIFLEKVYPALVRKLPGVELLIVGGTGARAIAEGYDCFKQPNVEVLEYVEDIRPLLKTCAVTINPRVEMRGTSLKVIESIAAGRVCVSTREGARGFLAAGFPSLVTVESIEDFLEPLLRLLSDASFRLSIETPPLDRLKPFTWEEAGRTLREHYAKIIS